MQDFKLSWIKSKEHCFHLESELVHSRGWFHLEKFLLPGMENITRGGHIVCHFSATCITTVSPIRNIT